MHRKKITTKSSLTTGTKRMVLYAGQCFTWAHIYSKTIVEKNPSCLQIRQTVDLAKRFGRRFLRTNVHRFIRCHQKWPEMCFRAIRFEFEVADSISHTTNLLDLFFIWEICFAPKCLHWSTTTATPFASIHLSKNRCSIQSKIFVELHVALLVAFTARL